MKKMVWKSTLASICFAVVLIAGCGEKEAPSVKQSRAIAAENIELQKELNRSNARIEETKRQYDKELEKQRQLLEKCQREREQWREKSRQNVRDQVKDVLDPVMADNARLRAENAKLKAQLETLEK
ncbi:MAG: hypothetical protein ACYSWO_24155 [Planctomycetota bacterium]|jgi:predicted Holliday junction resolvase-like endonuclease